jgi:ribosomal protein S21
MFQSKKPSFRPGYVTVPPLEVISRPGDSPEKLVKRFMKKVRNDGILQEFIGRRRFVPNNQKKKRKSSKAQYLRQKELEKTKNF